ncbi:hypothetical protein FDP41_004792 [Naegleria fowleri]|uniref:RGS domain-containing protein n=1 Tax=Naegleria fowleri TaxID=5763 RepID=A0A6A5BGU1_NAEFO|nr:uncharacterized protein FDP41_004792 [Naegleria fowleri]KAF0976117.1 hypothetical protein FDP41_004792 [Naegleria fowleri]
MLSITEEPTSPRANTFPSHHLANITAAVKQHPMEIQQYPSLSNRKSSLSNKRGIQIEMSCASFALSPTKCLLLSVLILNIAAFCILLGLLINVFVHKKEQRILSVEMRGQALLYSEILSSSARLAAYSKNSNITSMFVERYQTYYPQYISLLNQVFELIPPQVITTLLNRTSERFNLTQDEPVVMENAAIELIKQGKQAEAVAILDSDHYADEKDDYNNDLNAYVDYLKNEEVKKDDAISNETLASMVVVVVLMAIVLPVVVITLIASFNNEKQQRAKIEKAKAIMLQDTMSDAKLRELFKKHCEKEFSLENFYLLDRIQEYQSLCDKSFEIQSSLFEMRTSGSEDNAASTATSRSNSSGGENKKRGNTTYSEKDLEMVEKQKRVLALYIHDTHININGSMPVNINKKFGDQVMFEIAKESPVLPETLFDGIQHEIFMVMGDTHHRFKQSLAFQKKMKIDNIKSRASRSK